MSDNPIQDLAVATASAVIAAHAKDAFYIVMGMWYYTFGCNWDLNTEKIQIEHLRKMKSTPLPLKMSKRQRLAL